MWARSLPLKQRSHFSWAHETAVPCSAELGKCQLAKPQGVAPGWGVGVGKGLAGLPHSPAELGTGPRQDLSYRPCRRQTRALGPRTKGCLEVVALFCYLFQILLFLTPILPSLSGPPAAAGMGAF